MTTPTPGEIAELDQDYAAVVEMVDDLIADLRTSLRAAGGDELALVGEIANAFVLALLTDDDVDSDRICMVAAIALVRAASQGGGS